MVELGVAGEHMIAMGICSREATMQRSLTRPSGRF